MNAQDLCNLPGLATPDVANPHPRHLSPHSTANAGTSVISRSAKAPNPGNVAVSDGTRPHCIIYQWPADASKRFATLRARLALKGYCLHRTAADDGPARFYVTRWGMARELCDLEAVAQFVNQVGCTHV